MKLIYQWETVKRRKEKVKAPFDFLIMLLISRKKASVEWKRNRKLH